MRKPITASLLALALAATAAPASAGDKPTTASTDGHKITKSTDGHGPLRGLDLD